MGDTEIIEHGVAAPGEVDLGGSGRLAEPTVVKNLCLLYTSDAADDMPYV